MFSIMTKGAAAFLGCLQQPGWSLLRRLQRTIPFLSELNQKDEDREKGGKFEEDDVSEGRWLSPKSKGRVMKKIRIKKIGKRNDEVKRQDAAGVKDEVTKRGTSASRGHGGLRCE